MEITNFEGFDADELSEDTELQQEIASITQQSISKGSANYSIEQDSYSVIYVDCADQCRYSDGNVDSCLFVEESLCAVSANDLQSLKSHIRHENGSIGDIMAESLTLQVLHEMPVHAVGVIIWLLNQFSTDFRITDVFDEL